MRRASLIVCGLASVMLFAAGRFSVAAAGPITAAIRLDTPTVSTSESIVFDVTVKNATDGTPAQQAYVSIIVTDSRNVTVWKTVGGQDLRTQTDGYVHVVIGPTSRNDATGVLTIAATILDATRTAQANATSTVTVTTPSSTPSSATAGTSSDSGATSSEDKPLVFTPEIPLPTFTGGPVTGTMIAEYIRAVYIYLVWTVGILATVMVIWGGIKWVVAAGNPTRISDARDTINNAVIGVIIALTSVLLLGLINPDLVKLRSVSPGSIEPQLLQVIKAIETEAGELTRCDKTQVAGEPSKVCSGRHAVYNPNHPLPFECGDLNNKVNVVAQNFQSTGLDHFMLKAIIMIESPKVDGQPYSGPEGNTGPGNTPGPGYGIGQFKVPTLLEVLPKVNVGGLPPPCKKDRVYAADGIHISNSCKEWLDRQHYVGLGMAGIDAQVQMIAYYFSQQLQDQKCIKGNPILAAAAYNRGLGGATGAFCDPSSYKGTTDLQTVKAKALNYIAEFKKQYAAACAAGVK